MTALIVAIAIVGVLVQLGPLPGGSPTKNAARGRAKESRGLRPRGAYRRNGVGLRTVGACGVPSLPPGTSAGGRSAGSAGPPTASAGTGNASARRRRPRGGRGSRARRDGERAATPRRHARRWRREPRSCVFPVGSCRAAPRFARSCSRRSKSGFGTNASAPAMMAGVRSWCQPENSITPVSGRSAVIPPTVPQHGRPRPGEPQELAERREVLRVVVDHEDALSRPPDSSRRTHAIVGRHGG